MPCGRIMQGLGYGKPTLILTLIRVVIINAPLGYFITRILELPIFYIWYSILFSSFVASTLGLLWMKKVINNEKLDRKIMLVISYDNCVTSYYDARFLWYY